VEELTELRWRKSSYSGNGGGDCVEVARNLTGVVLVRDSKDEDGPALAFTEEAWSALVRGVKQGEFDL
jgi:Domain of unknown function (DUF397)